MLIAFSFFIGIKGFSQAPPWIWAKEANSAGGETINDVAIDKVSGNMYAVGVFAGGLNAAYGAAMAATNGGTDAFLAKYNSAGTVVWAIKIGGATNDAGNSVACDPAGNVYVTGFFTGTADFDPTATAVNLVSTGAQDVFIAKYSSAGALIWAVKGGGATGNDFGQGISADANGVYVTGAYVSSAVFTSTSVATKTTTAGQALNNVFVAKYTLGGVVQWVASAGSTQNDQGWDIVADASNVYVIGDYANTLTIYNGSGVSSGALVIQGTPNTDVFIMAFGQAAGAYVWVNNISSATVDIGRGITVDASGLYVTGGISNNANFKNPTPTFTQAVTGLMDMYVSKIDKITGNFLWKRSDPGTGAFNEAGTGIANDGAGRIYVTGYFNNTISFVADGGPLLTTSNVQDIFVVSYTTSNGFFYAAQGGGTGLDQSNACDIDANKDVYIGGTHASNAVFGAFTLTAGFAPTNVMVAKIGCSTILSSANASSDQTVCATTCTLAGNTPTTGTGSWSLLSGAGSITTPTSPTSGVTALGVGANQFIWTISGSGCTPSRDTVRIWQDQAPTVSNAGPTQSVCAVTNATLAGNVPAVGTGSWTLVSGAGTITTPTLATSGITALGTGTTNVFRWTISNGSCPVSTSIVAIIQYLTPTASNAGSTQTVCATTATLGGNVPVNGIGNWSLLSGAATITTPTLATSGLTALGTGTNVFQWTISNGNCATSSSTVAVIRTPSPTVSNAGLPQSVCATTATLAGNVPAVGTGSWTVVGGAGTITTPTLATSGLTALGVGANSFQWAISNGICPVSTSTVTITRYLNPTVSNAGLPQSVCSTTATLAGNVPAIGTGSWTVVSGSGTITTPTLATSGITALGVGVNVFQWTVSNGACAPSSSTVAITQVANPTVSNAGPLQSVCATTATLAGNVPAVGTGSWTLVSGAGTITTPTLATSGLTALGTGTNVFQWTISNGVCAPSSSTVAIVQYLNPTISNAGSSQTVCATTATLGGNVPAIGTGSWTLVGGSGTIATTTLATSPLSALGIGSNIFQWTISNGACPVSSSTVAINQDANPTVSNAGSTQTVCATTATLGGNVPAIGTGSWTLVSGTGTITTPTLATSGLTALGIGTNIFQWTISNGVCASSSSTVAINQDANPTIANAGTSQTICTNSYTLAGNTPTIGTGLWTLVSGIGTITTPTLETSGLTALGIGVNIFQWTISNGVCASSSSTVAITQDPNPTVSNAGLPQSVCSASATLAGNSPAIGTGTWTLLSGAGTITVPTYEFSSVTGLGVGTNVFQWTISNGVCPSSSSTVAITQFLNPTIASAGSSQTICANTYTLAGNTPVIGSGLWTLVSGIGTITTPTSPTSGLTALGIGTNIFQWTISNGVCASSSSTVAITQDPNPTVSNAGLPQSVCSASATLAGNSPAIGTGTWTLVSGAGTITIPTYEFSSVTGLGVGTNVFQWTISNGVCPSSSSTVAITQFLNPSIASAGSSQTICANTYTLAGNTPVIGTGLWTLVSGIGTITTPTSPTSALTALGIGTNIFQWTISNGVCASSSSTVAITQDANPTVSNAGLAQSVCATTTTLAGNVPAVGTGLWNLVSGGGTITTPTLASSGLTAVPIGTNIFQWTISNGVCPTSSSTVAIIRDANPTISNAGTSQTICATTYTMTGNIPVVGTGLWNLVSGAGTITTPTLATTGLTALGVGANVFAWTISNGVCPSSNSTVSIKRNANPTISNAGSSQTVCATIATLGGNVPGIGSGLWTLVSGAGTITTPTLATSGLTALGVGTNIFQWTISNGVCPSSSSTVSIVRDANPTVSNAGLPQSICTSTALLSGNNPVNGTGLWNLVSGSGTITTPTLATSALTALGVGVNVFQWTISNGVCPSSSSTVAITRFANPTISNAGSSQTICATTYTMTGNVPVVGNGLWTLVSGIGTITTPTLATTGLTALGVGANTFQWTISNGVCPSSSSTVTITRDANPTIANAGASQTICANTYTLAGNVPIVGTGSWNLVSGIGTITTPTLATSGLTALGIGANIFQWTISNGVCPSSSSTVAITQNANPTVSNAGPSQTICPSTTTLAGNTPAIGNGLWTLVSGVGTITTPTLETSGLTAIGIGTNIFQWTISNGVCTVSSSTVAIFRNANPTISNAGPSQTVCATNYTLGGNVPVVGIGNWNLISGTGTILTPTVPNAAIIGLGVGPNIFEWTISNGICPASTSTVMITLDANPTIANAGISQTICATTFTLGGNTPTVGTGLWNLVSGVGTIITPTLATSGLTALGVGANIFQWTISNGVCPASTSTVAITRNANPTIANAGTSQTICTNTYTLAGNAPVIGTGLWNLVSGIGTITTPTSPTSALAALGIGTNIFQWTISNGVCPSTSATVTITQDANPTIASAGLSQTICANTYTLAGNTPTVGTGLWNLVSGVGTITTPTLATSGLTALGIGANTFQWTISNGVCPSSSATVTIMQDANPTIATAGLSQTICANTYTLAGNTPTVGTGLWNLVSGVGTITTPTLETSGLTSLGIGANTFQWTISNGVCPSTSATVTITQDANPTIAFAGTNQTLCAVSLSTLTSNSPTVGTGVWNVLIGGSTVVTPTNNISPVNTLSLGINTFEWVISNGVCPSTRDTVVIQIDDNPTIALAGTNQTLCAATTSTLIANSPTVGTGTWNVLIGGSTVVTPTNNISPVNTLTIGINTFEWVISNGVCPSTRDTVVIQIDDNPTPALAGPDQVHCITSATFAANSPTVGTGIWNLVSGTGTIISPASNTATVTGLTLGLNYFEWTISNGVCPASKDTMIMNVIVNLLPIFAGPDQFTCTLSPNLNAMPPPVGTGSWVPLGGAPNVNSPTNPNSTITFTNQGTYTYVWEVGYLLCPVEKDTVQITTYLNPSASLAGADQFTCSLNSVLNSNTPAIGSGTWIPLGTSPAVTNPTLTNSSVTFTDQGTYTYVWSIGNGTCPVENDTVIINSFSNPSPAKAGPDQTICSFTTNFGATIPTIGIGTWIPLTATTSVISNTLLANSSLTVVGQGLYGYVWEVSNSVYCPVSTDTVFIQTYENPTTANAGPDFNSDISQITLAANSPTVGFGSWSILSGAGTFNSITNPQTPFAANGDGELILMWVISNGNCPPSSDTITVKINPLLLPQVITPNGDGNNDFFEIKGFKNISGIKLTVFNRWGNIVYESSDYKNDFKGLNNQQEKLADDTYYYLLDVSEKTYKGYLILKTN